MHQDQEEQKFLVARPSKANSVLRSPPEETLEAHLAARNPSRQYGSRSYAPARKRRNCPIRGHYTKVFWVYGILDEA